MKRLAKIWREPLVHFLLIGAALFLLFDRTRGQQSGGANRIVVSPGQVEQLVAQFQRTWMRPPTEDERAGLIEEHVRNEVYYREASAMGLDRNDPIIRQRLRQKLEFILDDLTTVDPDDAALSAFLRENADLFRLEPRVSFRQVYLNPDKRNELAVDAGRLLAELNRGSPPESLGDPTMAAYEHSLATRSDIARWFGNSFAEQVVAMQPGEWEGPLYSGLGAHLVRVTERREGRMPELDEVRKQVEREYVAKRRKEAKDIAYAKLREKYEVILQPPTEEGGEAEDGAFASTRRGEAAR